MELFQLTAVLLSGGHDIDTGGIDAAVAQNICQLGNVLFDAIECAGKQAVEKPLNS